MKRYAFAITAGLLALCLGLVACAPKPTAAPTASPTTAPTAASAATVAPTVAPTEVGPCPEGVTTVKIWHGYSGDYQTVIEGMFDAYNATNTDCVSLEYARVDNLSDSLAVAVPAGEGPDILAWANDQIGRNALAGNLAPIDEWVDRAYLEDNFTPPAVAGVIWNDQIWALPETMEGIALVYNKALLSDADLPNPDDFEDLLAKATAFREAHPDPILSGLISGHLTRAHFSRTQSAVLPFNQPCDAGDMRLPRPDAGWARGYFLV